MKKTIFLIALLCVAVACSAQTQGRNSRSKGQNGSMEQNEKQYLENLMSRLQSSLDDVKNRIASIEESQKKKVDNYSKEPGTAGSLYDRMVSLTQQLESLNKDINAMYAREKASIKTDADMEKLKDERLELQSRLKAIDDSIAMIDRLCGWVDTLRNYYSSGNIDTLFAHADPVSFRVHKQILGNNLPKQMKDLEILLECSTLLSKDFDEKKTQECLNRLKTVRKNLQSETVNYFIGVLYAYKEVNDAVNAWMTGKDADHSVYGWVSFRSYMLGQYGMSLDKDYPRLAQKAREFVEFQTKK